MSACTAKQFRRYEHAFVKLANRREYLPVESLGDYIRLTGVSATPEELDAVIPEYSVNGTLNFASVLDMLSRFQQAEKVRQEQEDLMTLFKLLDETDSGYVYVDELKQACLLAGDALREKEFNHLLYSTALSGRERLSFYEYMEVLLKLPHEPA